MVNLALARNRLRDRPVRRTSEAHDRESPPSPLARLPAVNGKAAPTLSLSAPDAPTNCIPFPSAPVPCAGRAADCNSDEAAMDVDPATPVRNVRKRAKSGTPGDANDDDDLTGARRMQKRSMLRKATEGSNARLPPPKRARKAKKPGPETRFLALVHRSVAWHIRHVGAAASQDACAAQDVLLTKRLWRHLLDQGLQPTPVEDDAAMDTADGPAAVRSSPPPPGPANMLSMPQLVAVLTLRHRERPANRPRPTPKDGLAAPRRPSSPLARVIFSAP